MFSEMEDSIAAHGGILIMNSTYSPQVSFILVAF